MKIYATVRKYISTIGTEIYHRWYETGSVGQLEKYKGWKN